MRMKDRSIEIEQDKVVSTLGGRLQYARRVAGITQEELGVAVELTRSSIAQYEGGHATPPLEVIFKLAASVGVDPRFLIFGDESGEAHDAFAGGRLVPVGHPTDDAAFAQPVVGLPSMIVSEFGAKTKELRFLALAVSAPHFGLCEGSYLLLETGLERIAADGLIYAVNSSAGLALVRSEPQFGAPQANMLQLTDGHGQGRQVEASDLVPAGRLLATLQGQPGGQEVRRGRGRGSRIGQKN